jgi:hypothetical protein
VNTKVSIRTIRKRDVIEWLREAASSTSGVARLREIVYDRFTDDDDYVVEAKEVDRVIEVLSDYLLYEEDHADPHRSRHLDSLRAVLEKGEWTAEAAVVVLNEEELKELVRKAREGRINPEVLSIQIKKLSGPKVEPLRILQFLRRRTGEDLE